VANYIARKANLETFQERGFSSNELKTTEIHEELSGLKTIPALEPKALALALALEQAWTLWS
jgi:hypothetical protein